MLAVTRMVNELKAHRELLVALSQRDLRVRYKQAVMGVLWVFFLPTLAVSSGLIMKAAVTMARGEAINATDVATMMIRMPLWLMFAGIVGGASNSLVGNMHLLTKIYFPRAVIPLATVAATLFDFAISLAAVAVLLVVLPLTPAMREPVIVWSPWLLLVVPLILVIITLATGLGMILACANLFFRDVKYIVQVLLQFGIFFSPVIFSFEKFSPRVRSTLMLNPLSPLLEATSDVVVRGAVPAYLWPWLAYSTLFAFLNLFISLTVFERAESLFAEYA